MTDGKQPTSSSDQSAAKRMKMDGKKNLKDLTSEEFVSRIQCFHGPEALFRIDGKEYILPMRLVCHNSKYFDRAFSSELRENQEKELQLEVTTHTFNMVIQWMYCRQITLPPLPADKPASESHREKLTALVDFFIFVDKVDLMGPFDTIVEQIKEILVSSHLNLSAEHIRKVAGLPTGHPVRRLFAESCVIPFFYHLLPAQKCPNTKIGIFRFQKEIDEVDMFAVDLLKVYQEHMRKRKTNSERRGFWGWNVKDTLTGELIEDI